MPFIESGEFPVLPRVPVTSFKDARQREYGLYAGLYLFGGETGTGKSVGSIALGAAIGDSSGSTVTFAHANEATGRPMSAKQLMSMIDGCQGSVLIVDSITDLFLTQERPKKGSTTFKGGLTPEHVLLMRQLQTYTYDKRCALVAIVNSSLLPIGDLEGAVEGAIGIVRLTASSGQLTKRDRKRRIHVPIELKQDWIERAFDVLHYDPAEFASGVGYSLVSP